MERSDASAFQSTDRVTLESGRLSDIVAAAAVAIGLWLRLRIATGTYLNPDEAIFFFAGSVDTFKELFDNIVRSQHAPLPIVLLHFIEPINSSELALRVPALIAGSLFPWVVYRWLGEIWSRTAGLMALVVLTFSPALVSLSAQARGYTLVLLFAALALRWLDAGVAARSGMRIIASAICVALAVMTEFSGAMFAVGAAAYFLIRLRDRLPGRLVVVWAIGQAAAAAIAVALYLTIAVPHVTADAVNPNGVSHLFVGAYRQPGENLLVFLATATARQFSFLFGSHVAGLLAMPMFAAALVGLCLKKRYALAALLVTPILVAWAGVALAHPFGRTRHTAILSLVVASGVAIGTELVLRRRTRLLIAVLPVVMTVTGWPDVNDIAPGRHRRDSMLAAIRYLQTVVPPDGVLFTDRETGLILRYYLRDEQPLPNWQLLREVQLGNLYMVANRNWDFGDAETFADDLAWLRQLLGTGSNRSIWIADGGSTIVLRPDLLRRYPQLTLPEARTFDGAVDVFRLPPDL